MMNSKISAEQKDEITQKFSEIQNLEDFCNLLDFCQQIIYNQRVIKINAAKIKFLSHQNSDRRYKTFEIKKKSGESRLIHSPHSHLKVVLKCINLILQCVYEPHNAAYGFIPGRSIVDNAKLHSNNQYVFNIDLKDFFPSVEIGRVINRLNFPPFNLKKDKARGEIAKYIGWLCCTKMLVNRLVNNENIVVEKVVLPQGSPVSPIMTNIICEKLDISLSRLAGKFGLRYSRYADDITFSSMHSVYAVEGHFRKKVNEIVTDQKFTINQKKVRLQSALVHQEVTGITVNNSTNVPRRYIKTLRLWLHNWEVLGSEEAFRVFRQIYLKDKGNVKVLGNTSAFMISVIRGKLDYLSMVKGKDDPTYLKLADRFNSLAGSTFQNQEQSKDWKMVLNDFVNSDFDFTKI